jgi:hypothetical protein
MSAQAAPAKPAGRAAVPEGMLGAKLVGTTASLRDEINGYIFWGLVALFIGVPEVLAATSKRLKADIPWPTISNLVGKDLERHHHWIALIVVGLIVMVLVHTLIHPDDKKKAGRSLRMPADDAQPLQWGRVYIGVVALAGIAAGLIAWALGANKNELGYAIYLTLTGFGVVLPSALAYWRHRVLDIPTAFATIAFLRVRAAWVAVFVAALLVVLLFHLALYPWPNYNFG